MKIRVIEQLIKSNYKSLSEQIKILRKYEKHSKRMASKKRKDNAYNSWDKTRENFYKTRKELSREARYTGLARQFIRGVLYSRVENSNKEGNVARIQEISSILSDWGIKHDPLDIFVWIDERDGVSENA